VYICDDTSDIDNSIFGKKNIILSVKMEPAVFNMDTKVKYESGDDPKSY
jgi:hypothetical protein